MPATFRVEIDQYAYNAALDWVTSTPQTIARIVETYVRPEVQEIVERELAPYPGKPRYPLRWASERQRKFVMAKLRAEGNLPYQRTGGLARRWIVRALPTDRGAVLETGNTSSIARYVVGRNQQPFHSDTGWPTLQRSQPTIVTQARAAFYDGYKTYQQQTFRKIKAR